MNASTITVGEIRPSKEERVLAGIAHLGMFGGFWLVAPLLIYFYKRRESPFVAFHAIQACLLNVLTIPLSIAGVVLGFIGMIVFGLIANGEGHPGSSGAFAAFGTFGFVGAMLLPNLVIAIVALVAGVRALRGQEWSIPLVGRLARSVTKD